MDIHKPKPWHGLREFLKEYVIIVVGVLTALGAEQAVEWAHWRYEVAEARKTLDVEIAGNLAGLVRRREVAPCIQGRLADLRRYLSARAAGDRAPPPAPVGHPRLARMWTNAWESAKADQVIGHMSERDRRAYTHVYDGFAFFELRTRETFDDWATLELVDDAPLLDASSFARIAEARMREVAVSRALEVNLDRQIAETQGLAPQARQEEPPPDDLCRPWYPAAK